MDEASPSTDPTPPAEPTPSRPRAGRFLRRAAWRIPGTVALTGVAFALVTAAAGSDSRDLSDAQPIDYNEECHGEGCDSEEVHELWWTLREECVVEGCWMEEVGENAGTPILYDPSGFWVYANPYVVNDMFVHMRRLGHSERIQWTPGPTPVWANDRSATGDEATVTCEEEDDGGYDCKP